MSDELRLRDKDCARDSLVSTSTFQNFNCFMQFLLSRFAFRIYDIDNDGYISNGELFQVNISPANKEICVIIVIYSGVEDDGGQ